MAVGSGAEKLTAAPDVGSAPSRSIKRSRGTVAWRVPGTGPTRRPAAYPTMEPGTPSVEPTSHAVTSRSTPMAMPSRSEKARRRCPRRQGPPGGIYAARPPRHARSSMIRPRRSAPPATPPPFDFQLEQETRGAAARNRPGARVTPERRGPRSCAGWPREERGVRGLELLAGLGAGRAAPRRRVLRPGPRRRPRCWRRRPGPGRSTAPEAILARGRGAPDDRAAGRRARSSRRPSWPPTRRAPPRASPWPGAIDPLESWSSPAPWAPSWLDDWLAWREVTLEITGADLTAAGLAGPAPWARPSTRRWPPSSTAKPRPAPTSSASPSPPRAELDLLGVDGRMEDGDRGDRRGAVAGRPSSAPPRAGSGRGGVRLAGRRGQRGALRHAERRRAHRRRRRRRGREPGAARGRGRDRAVRRCRSGCRSTRPTSRVHDGAPGTEPVRRTGHAARRGRRARRPAAGPGAARPHRRLPAGRPRRARRRGDAPLRLARAGGRDRRPRRRRRSKRPPPRSVPGSGPAATRSAPRCSRPSPTSARGSPTAACSTCPRSPAASSPAPGSSGSSRPASAPSARPSSSSPTAATTAVTGRMGNLAWIDPRRGSTAIPKGA